MLAAASSFIRSSSQSTPWHSTRSAPARVRNSRSPVSSANCRVFASASANVSGILLRWADVGTPANLSNFDEYRLAFLEKMTNQAFTKIQGSLVNPASVPFLQEAWETAMQTFSDRFLVQGMLGDIFPNASYDFATDSLHLGSSLADIVGNVHTSVLAHDYIFINDLGRILNTYPEDLGADTSEISIAVSNLLAEALLGEGGDYGLGALLANLHIDNVIDATQEGIASFISGQGNLLTTEGTFHNDRIIGSDETNIRDVIYGQDGDDLLIGNKGNDALYAYGGNDILVGGEGNDSLSSSGDGHDFLLGGDGNDDFTIKDSCTVVGGDGNDRVFGTSAVKNEQIFLGAGNDRINVTIQDSVAFLGGGNDTAAGAFNSQVFLEDGDDRVGIQNGGSSNPFYQLNSLLDAGSGNDIIYLSLLNQSTLIGGEGNDTLFGGGIVSYGQIYGGNGDDSVSAGGVQNPGVIQSTLSGGMGNDTVAAGDSAIRLEGNEGNDLIRHSGLSFVATLVGGTGNDTMISQDYRSHDTYLFYTEDGNDRMEYTPHNGSVALDSIFINDIHVSGEAQFYAQNIWRIAAAGTIFNLTLTGADLVLTEDGNLNDSITLANFDTVNGGYGITLGDPGLQLEGTSGNDTLIGSFAADVINGNGGADSIVGDDGDDTLTGGDNTSDDGQDTIYGGAGNDSILGGYHHDLLYGDDGDDIIDGGLHNDTINGGAGNDTLNGGISGADSLDGGLGDDLLLGGSNFDTLHGGDGNDSLDGGDADDTLYGDEGNDTLNGGISGADSLDGGLGDDLLLGGSNFDTLHGGDGNDSLDGGEADDTLYGDEGNDTLNGGISGADSLDGGLGDDLLLGGSNFDTLHGGGGNDSLDGGDADDTLYGDGGNDTLNGGSNNDTLTGGEDADMLIGGTGSDVFSFTTLNDSTSTSRDVIADFVKGQDKIDFSGITSITGIGNLSITLFENNTFITTGDGLDLCLNGNFTQGTNQLDAADFIF